MKKVKIYKYYNLVSFLFIILFLIGCSNSSKKPNPENEADSIPKLPKVLIELENEVLKVMYDLDSVVGIEKAIEKHKIIEAKNESKADMPAKEPKEGGAKEESEDKGENKEEDKPDIHELIGESEIIIPLLEANDVKDIFKNPTDIPKDMNQVWFKLDNDVIGIHKKWNVLESELMSENVPSLKLEEFERILNYLTLSVMDRERLNSLKLANELTSILANFRSYFNSTGNHNIYSMYYHIRETILFAASDDYSQAIENIDEANKISDSLRQVLTDKDSKDTFQKFELSMEDLNKQLIAQNFHLSQIKAPIVIKNIRLLEDILKARNK